MNTRWKSTAEAGLIVVAGAALVWIGGGGAFASDTSTAAASSSVAERSTPRDRDCRDFATQAAAQAALTRGDRAGLDADRDGVACEEHFRTERQQVRVRPSGPVQTGGHPPG